MQPSSQDGAAEYKGISRVIWCLLRIPLLPTERWGWMEPMDRPITNVINGELVAAASGATYEVIDPSTGQTYASAPLSGAEDVDRAFDAAATAFETWRDTTPYERSKMLHQLARAIEDRAQEIVDVESRDT